MNGVIIDSRLVRLIIFLTLDAVGLINFLLKIHCPDKPHNLES
jgi:hypothetical protein